MNDRNIKINNLRVEGESTVKGDFALDISPTITQAGDEIVDADISEAEYYEKMPKLLDQISSSLARISRKQKNNTSTH